MPVGRMFTTEEAAAYLEVGAESVRRAVRKGWLRAIRDNLHNGRPLRYTKDDLDAYRASRIEEKGGT